jgi:hypothetical protein
MPVTIDVGTGAILSEFPSAGEGGAALACEARSLSEEPSYDRVGHAVPDAAWDTHSSSPAMTCQPASPRPRKPTGSRSGSDVVVAQKIVPKAEGSPMREGAIGAAGIRHAEEPRGDTDPFGNASNPMTSRVDEIGAAASILMGQTAAARPGHRRMRHPLHHRRERPIAAAHPARSQARTPVPTARLPLLRQPITVLPPAEGGRLVRADDERDAKVAGPVFRKHLAQHLG